MSKPHDHNHQHGPHEHELPRQGAVPARNAPPHEPPDMIEDPGSRALSEALRSSFVLVKVIMVILVVVFLASGVFTVPSQEQAIILRFGKPVGTGEEQLLGPGLHWSFPYPIDEVVRIPLGQVQTVSSTAGWYMTTPEMERAGTEPWAGPSLNPAIDGYTLTSDGNIIHVRVRLSYRITDPLQYALNYVNGSRVVQSALDNALFHVSAQFKADQALREEVIAFKERIESRVRQLVAEKDLGIVVEQAEVRSIPPRQVADAFLAVTEAEVERRGAINSAQGYANSILSRAQGEANAIVNSGRTDRARRVHSIDAEANYFQQQLADYRNNPQVYMDRVQLDALHRILTNNQVQTWWLDDRGASRELRFQLNREPRAPASRRPQPPQQ
jgi:modulator of FtsH protease HflK